MHGLEAGKGGGDCIKALPIAIQSGDGSAAGLVLYLVHEAPEEEQEPSDGDGDAAGGGSAGRDDESMESPLDMLFSRLEMRDPESIALKAIPGLQNGHGKNSKSIPS